MPDAETILDNLPQRRRASLVVVVAPLVILAAFVAGFIAFIGWPKWPVIDAGERIAYSSIVAATLACLAAVVGCRWTRAAINFTAVLACVLPVLLPMVRPGDWTYIALVAWMAAVCVPMAILASLTQRLREADGTILAPLLTLGMTLGGGGLMMATGSLKLGEAGLSLATGVLITIALGLFIRPIGRSQGTITLAFAVLASLLTSGYVWSNLPLYAGLCVWSGPLLAWVVRVPIIARRRAWQRVVIGLLLAAIPATTAMTIEGIKAQHAAAAEEGEY